VLVVEHVDGRRTVTFAVGDDHVPPEALGTG
jgi:hypothetical protein